MPSLGVPELMIIFLIIIVLFGANRLPQIGKGIGEGIATSRRGSKRAKTSRSDPEKTARPATPEHPAPAASHSSSAAASRSMSTPEAVISGPAPGPEIVSGRSE